MNERMKIAFLTYGAAPVPATRGGAVENIIEGLLQENEVYHKFDMTVFSLYDEEAEKQSHKYKLSNFIFIKCPPMISVIDEIIYWISKNILNKNNLISYKCIFKRLFVMSHYPTYLIKEDYDRIIIVTNSTLFIVLKNKKVAEKYKNKVVLYLHNEIRSLFHCRNQVETIRGCIGISEYVNKEFRKLLPSISEEKCFVLRNGIDTNRFRKMRPQDRIVYRNRYKLLENDFVVLFAGRLVKEKGALEVIRAVKECNNNSIKLIVVGGGFYSTNLRDQYSRKLREESKKIEDRIIFANYIDYKEMPILYGISDLAVLPSIWEEPAGMTMLEAAISGTPLITTYSGGIQEYIPEESAIFLKRDEFLVQNLSYRILELMENSGLRERMSNNSQELREKYNLKTHYFGFETIMEKM